ncbi:hypothetical protein AAP_04524 [Ascosphaera apis ARSEF 7405]|uniref:Uncharacterized protein n=1 Tax=Ascosphaera apis ARSEF 7405 TaxID=392613 RepID=A0A167WMB9_9EURO|nr:hypothetical protein AAP_04524 [Ascosphaera apis ARSEF 7405]
MPPPAILGLIIGTSIAVAAAIAAYESPQVRELIRKGRQKLAEWLHALGDEVSPEEKRKILELHDISMTEEKGEEAERRRQRAREEIMQRATILERRRNNRFMTSDGKRGEEEANDSVSCPRPVPRPATSFDGLVDRNGKLISRGDYKENNNDATRETTVGSSTGLSTGVDLSGAAEQVQRQETTEKKSAMSKAAAIAAAATAGAFAVAGAAIAAANVDHTITDPFSDLNIIDESHPAMQPTPASEAIPEDERVQEVHDDEHDEKEEHEPTGFITPKTAATLTSTPSASAPATPRNREHIPIPENLEIPPYEPLSVDALREHEQQGVTQSEQTSSSYHCLATDDNDNNGNNDQVEHVQTGDIVSTSPRSPSVVSRAGTDVLSMTDTSADMLSDLESMRGGQFTPEWSEVGSVVSDAEGMGEDYQRH